jgi:hypothetical protein
MKLRVFLNRKRKGVAFKASTTLQYELLIGDKQRRPQCVRKNAAGLLIKSHV